MSRPSSRQQRSRYALPALAAGTNADAAAAAGATFSTPVAAAAAAAAVAAVAAATPVRAQQTPEEMLAATLRRVYPSPPPSSAPHSARPSSSPRVRTARRPGTGLAGAGADFAGSIAAQSSIHFQLENLAKYSLAPTTARSARSARGRQARDAVSFSGSSSRPATSQSARFSPWPATPMQPQSQPSEGESKEWSPIVPASARSSRSHKRNATSASASPSPPRRWAPLAGTDLAWGGGAESARLPPSLEPRACMESSMALARAELDFIHSGVFDVAAAAAQSGLQSHRSHQSALLQQLPPPPFAILPTMHMHLPLSLVPTPPPAALSAPPHQQLPPQQEEGHDDDDRSDSRDDIDIEALLQTHHAHSSALVARSLSSSPTQPPTLADAAAAAAAAAALSPADQATPAARAAHRAWLSRLNAQYDAEWAATEAQQVEREQAEIQQEYEAQKEAEWRERLRERAANNPRTHRAEKRQLARPEALQREKEEEQEEEQQQQPEESVAVDAAAAPADEIAPAQNAPASSPAPSPSSPLHSQFASFDPAMDEGIDVAALPLAFQIPVAKSSSNASKAQAPPVGEEDAATAAAAAEDADDMCTVDAEGVDVEQAVAQEAFATSAASARTILDRHDRYQARLAQQRQAGLDDKNAAAAAAAARVRLQHAGVEVHEDEPEEDENGGEGEAVAEAAHAAQSSVPASPSRSSPVRYLKTPGSAAAFFSASVAAAEQQVAQPQSPTRSSSDASAGASSNGAVLTTLRPATVTGAGTNQLQAASANRGDIIKSASLRTSGWGSQVARQQNQKIKAQAQAEARSRRMTATASPSAGQTPRRPAGSDGAVVALEAMSPAEREHSDSADADEHAEAEMDADADDADDAPAAATAVAVRAAASAPVGPFARPSSSHSQRSWSNRIKRNGVGESAGRGSDMRRHVAEVNSGTEWRALSSEAQALWAEHNAELERARLAEEERREREYDESQVKLHKLGKPLVSTQPSPSAASFPLPGATHAAADEERQEPPPSQAGLPRYMQKIDRAVAHATTREVHKYTPLASELRYESGAATSAAGTPRPTGLAGEQRMLVRSTPSPSRRLARAVASSSPPASDGGGSGSNDTSASHAQAQSTIFPPWLWCRADFQHSYSLVPFETCLRILHMYPDERTEMHLQKLREWIGQRAAQKATSSAAAAAAAEGEAGGIAPNWTRAFSPSCVGGTLVRASSTPQQRSRAPSRSPSRAASRAVSRAASRAVSRSGSRATLALGASHPPSAPPTLRTVVLPPSSVDYLAGLPRFLLDGVLRVIKPAAFVAGETIYRQGEPGDSFMVLQSGRAQSIRVDHTAVSSSLPPQSPAPLSTPVRSLSGGGGGGSNKRGSLSLGTGLHNLTVAIPSSPAPFPSSPGAGGSRSARSSVTFSPQPSVLRAGSSARPSLSAAASPAPASVTPSPAPTSAPAHPLSAAAGTETVQLLVVGNAFGHQHLAREMEATSQAGVARKRTLRLWHLLRLSVRRELREEEQLVSQLSRLTYGASSGDPDGSAAQAKSRALQRVSASRRRGGQGHSGGSGGGGGGGGGAGGLSETKIRAETVVALTDCVVFTISFYAFASLDFEFQQTKLRAGIAFLGQLRFFRTWTFSRLRHLYSLLLPRTLRRGETLWRQGGPADELCFVEEGALSLSREVVVTEGHRHPVRHLQWECEESTVAVSCARPFASAEARDYVGEDAVLDAPARDYTVRCRTDRARVWLLRKRYTHLLLRSRDHIDDVARLRRQAAAAAMAATLAERYPAHHASRPFVPVDWAACRAGAHGSGEVQALHYVATAGGSSTSASATGIGAPTLDPDGTAEFLYLPAGSIYVRWDPPAALLRHPAQSHSASGAQPTNTSPGDGGAAARPRRVYRLFTAPQSGAMEHPVSQYFSAMPNGNHWTKTSAMGGPTHNGEKTTARRSSSRPRSRARSSLGSAAAVAAAAAAPAHLADHPPHLAITFAEVVDTAIHSPTLRDHRRLTSNPAALQVPEAT